MDKKPKNQTKEWKDMSYSEKRDTCIVLSALALIPLGFIIGFGQAIFVFAAVWALYASYRIIKRDTGKVKKTLALVGIFAALSITGSVTGAATSHSTEVASEKENTQTTANLEEKRLSDEEIRAKEAEQKEQEENERKNRLFDVVSIVDGDTIKISYEGKVESLRLVGIDTPETSHPSKPVECFGKEATAYMTKLVSGKKVRLEEDVSQSSRDRYDRLLRFVFLEDGTHVNEKMIRDGYAFEYTYQNNPYKYQEQFKDAQKEARENSRGLWAANTCDGELKPAAAQSAPSKPAAQSKPRPSPAPEPAPAAGAVVKKSSSGICHAPGTTYYARTKNFTPYSSLQACLNSGGRLPKR